MKVQNKPEAYGFLAGMVVLIFAMLANASCAHAPKTTGAVEVAPTRTPVQRAQAAVRIVSPCGSGSGVLLDGAHVLTALHVINCAAWPIVVLPPVVSIQTSNGTSSLAIVEVADGQRDAARLRLKTAIEDVPPVRIRKARERDVLCAATAVPERAFRCGVVTATGRTPREYGDIRASGMSVWFGNSGSGVYAEDGMLVGVVARLEWCDMADALIYSLTEERVKTCAGRISSLTDSPVLL